MHKKLTYCGSLVRQHDPDRFFLSLFAPTAVRPDVWAVFAFNHEIAKTREIVSETQLGLIRLQWWREEITKIYNGDTPPDNEILQALAQAIKTHALPLKDFENLIYAREFDLEDVLPADMDGTIKYAAFTNEPLLSLVLLICGADPALEPMHAVAVNYGLMGVFRAVPFHAAQRRCYLPEQELHAHDIALNDVYEGRAVDALPALIADIAVHVDAKTKPIDPFLKAVHTHAVIHLKHLRRCKYNPHHPRMRFSPPFLALRVWLAVVFP